MFTISKEFHCSASHRLLHLPEDHPCHRMHGHNYVIILEFSADTLNDDSFVLDYRKTAIIKRWVDLTIDHRHLNEVFPSIRPTSENIAKHIFNRWKGGFPQLSAVVVKETPKTMARYEPTNDPYPDEII